jgi:hypothetical protein
MTVSKGQSVLGPAQLHLHSDVAAGPVHGESLSIFMSASSVAARGRWALHLQSEVDVT